MSAIYLEQITPVWNDFLLSFMFYSLNKITRKPLIYPIVLLMLVKMKAIH
jgi:hypothetical protein